MNHVGGHSLRLRSGQALPAAFDFGLKHHPRASDQSQSRTALVIPTREQSEEESALVWSLQRHEQRRRISLRRWFLLYIQKPNRREQTGKFCNFVSPSESMSYQETLKFTLRTRFCPRFVGASDDEAAKEQPPHPPNGDHTEAGPLSAPRQKQIPPVSPRSRVGMTEWRAVSEHLAKTLHIRGRFNESGLLQARSTSPRRAV